MTKKVAHTSKADAVRCLHHEPGWESHPELTRWVAPLEASFCVVCFEWIRVRDRQKFFRYVRDALAEGKTEEEIARAIELDGIADPFTEPPSTYLTILLAKAKYAVASSALK